MIIGAIVAICDTQTNHIFLVPGAVAGVVERKEELETQCIRGVEGLLKWSTDGTDFVGDIQSKSVDMSFLSQTDICLPVGLSIIVCVADL